MNNLKNREQIIKEFLGLDELSPTEAGIIRAGNGKWPDPSDRQYEKTTDVDEDIEIGE